MQANILGNPSVNSGIRNVCMADLDWPSVNAIVSVAPSKTSMNAFVRLRESEIKLQYQLDESRNELKEQRRYVEQLRQLLASQQNLLMQH